MADPNTNARCRVCGSVLGGSPCNTCQSLWSALNASGPSHAQVIVAAYMERHGLSTVYMDREQLADNEVEAQRVAAQFTPLARASNRPSDDPR